MSMASTTASRWTVSTRTRGEFQTAGVSAPSLELVLLGIPTSFTAAEAEGWLRDLAGVATETSREDSRARAIPTLLHHALTGLLFSQAELWSQPGSRGPCSVAFVDAPEGPALGWVGEARVQVIVEGALVEPQWVIVRDQDGREARAARLPGDRTVALAIEFWPGGEDGTEAPVAVEAEWLAPGVERIVAIPATAQAPETSAIANAEPPAESAAVVSAVPAPESPRLASLPLQQPGFAASPHEQHPGDAGAGAPAKPPPAESGDAPARAESAEALGPHVTAMLDAMGSGTMIVDDDAHAPAEPQPRAQHPVGRWLGRLLAFGRRQRNESEPAAPAAEAPLSEYDSLLSSSVPPSVLEPAEQTTLELPQVEPPLLVEPDAPDFAVHEPMAAPGAIGPGPLHVTGVRDELVRTMNEVNAAALPVLHTPASAAGPESAQPLQIDREPVGAHEVFAIPVVPVRPAPPRPIVVRVLPTPGTPESPAASAAPEPELAGSPAEAPPMWQVPIARVVVRGQTPIDVQTSSLAPEDTALPAPSPAGSAALEPALPPMAPPPEAALEPVTGPVMAREPEIAVPGVEPFERVEVSPAEPPSAQPVAEPAPETGDDPFVSAERPTIPRRPWPALEAPAPRRLPKRLWAWGGVVAAVFFAGWLLGQVTTPTAKGTPGMFTRLLRVVGLGAPHFVATVNSSPNGAWIALDGKDLARRTPADVEMSPGAHTVKLSLPELGGTEIPVQGARDEKVAVNASLNGGLEVYASDASVPISVSLDGREVGFAPVRLESVVPGLHELQFTGPGMPAWAQTVQVGVRRSVQVVAHPMSAPANGVVQVQATLNDERGASPLSGAQVFVDGELKGVTPASFELPRGPHSLKLTWHGETAPIQVIDLPGGNQRFTSFNFGLDSNSPQLVLLGGVHPASADEQVIVSATLTTLQVSDVREAWLHVSTPDGLWRRYSMTAMGGARGPVLVGMFPPAALQGGSARWYVSASTQQGDEYFSEMQAAEVGAGGAARPRKRVAGAQGP